jgi:hypothetical protein
MWFRGTEFRVRAIEGGKAVAFIPTDAKGKKRSAVTIRVFDENESAMKVVFAWQPKDRIFFYHDDVNGVFENGLFKERTKEKFLL